MASEKKDTVLVILQLAGGNDALNTIIPYGDPLYMDNRPNVRIAEDQVVPLNDYIGFNPAMGPIKELYDEGKVAIIQGTGYPTPNRSHFRSMDIWHTCEPEKVGSEGWLGRAIQQIDPNKDNVLTGVNFGRGLPRAFVMPGVPVASVGNLETYGVLTGIEGEDQRAEALEVFSNIYSPAIGRGMVMDYLSQTGIGRPQWSRYPQHRPRVVLLLPWSMPVTRWPSTSEISPRYTWPTSVPKSFTPRLPTIASIPMRLSPPHTRGYGRRSPVPSTTSTRT